MRVSMHGGILTENVIQALARDVFADCLLRLDEAGIEVILHAHDEAVCLVDTDKAEEKLKQITEIMSTAPAWMKELPQAAEGKTCERYTK
jgi:DNA polymerase